MLQKVFPRLTSLNIILASTSPRRKEILEGLHLDFQIKGSSFEENLDKSSFNSPTDYVLENGKQKALDVARTMLASGESFDLVIGADTVVVMDGDILEKPKTALNATIMLNRLNNKMHTVHSGVALVSHGKEKGEFNICQFSEITEVDFGILNDEIIKAYVETDEPLDKAGAYGIQGIGGSLVKGIRGDYYNVVGFTLHKFCQELSAWIQQTPP